MSATQDATTTGGGRQEDRDTGLARLLTGRSDVDFVGRSRTWLIVSLVILGLCVVALLVRGLNFSIEFTGGTGFSVADATEEFDAADIRDALGELGVEDSIVQVVGDGEGAAVSTPALADLEGVDETQVVTVLEETTGGAVSFDSVSARWGETVTRQALQGLVVFLVLVLLYITFRFEWRMAVAAVLTLAHDVAVTVGLYALVGFTVSPSTVIAILTILGYSLYDTVVVFDRITEDAGRLTSVSTTSYGQLANQALNNVLVRSLSTSITSVLPVASLLFVGASLLGAATLSDLALALFIGMTVGTYSSVVVATPLLVWLKEKDPKYAELKQRAGG